MSYNCHTFVPENEYNQYTTMQQGPFRIIPFDVMLGDRYVFTLRYKFCPAFKIDFNDVYKKVIEKRPSLKDKHFTIVCDNKI